MAVVNATIKNRITTVPDDAELICNNPTDVIQIDFDDEWSGKTGYVARFEWNGKYYDVPFTGNQVQVPELSNTAWIMFGVYADNITAAPTKIKCKKSILCYGNGVRQVPANPFYDEFVERLENVEEAIENGAGGGSGGSGGITKETDPTVPAWAKQPEKPKYTAEEVGAQPKGDYALKSEIPDPYILPTASAEVKGGVKIGKGLEMDGETVRIVPEGVYELIETITVVEEDVKVIDRTAEPDGTRYDFKAIYLHSVTPKSQQNGFMYTFINGKIHADMRESIVTADEGSTGQVMAECKYGMIEGYAVAARSVGTSATKWRYVTQANIPMGHKNINTLQIRSTVSIPVNTVIKIWGVRA